MKGDVKLTKFIPFTEAQLIAANSIDLVALLKSQGESLEKAGKAWRWKRNTSVTIQGNKWYQHKYQTGGYSIKFMERFFHMDFPEAVQALLAFDGMSINASDYEVEAPKEFIAPEKNNRMKHVYGYLLKTRFISHDIVNAFVQENLLYEDKYHNVVFAGYDEEGIMKHAQLKGTMKGFGRNVSGTDPKYSFHYIGTSTRVFVFEAPIDMLSYISLHPQGWEEHTYIANCGLSMIPLFHHIQHHKNIKEVVLCFDCDSAGDEATWRFKDALEMKGYEVSVQKSEFNDWNEDLKHVHGVEPKPAIINPKYKEYDAILDKIVVLYDTQNVYDISFQSLMLSYSNLLSKLADETQEIASLQNSFEDLSCKAYALYKRSSTINRNPSDDTNIKEIKEIMSAHYRSYKDTCHLKAMTKEIKMHINDLKLHFHKQSGDYLGSEIIATYLQLAEDCAMASRIVLAESQDGKMKLSLKNSTSKMEESNYQMVMK